MQLKSLHQSLFICCLSISVLLDIHLSIMSKCVLCGVWSLHPWLAALLPMLYSQSEHLLKLRGLPTKVSCQLLWELHLSCCTPLCMRNCVRNGLHALLIHIFLLQFFLWHGSYNKTDFGFCTQVLTCDECVLYVVSSQIKLAPFFDFQIPNLAFALLNF